MIVADLRQLRNQVVVTPNMEKAIAFLEESGQAELEVGRVTIDGDKVYAEVQAYDSVEGPIETFEGHRKYIDIQYVAGGEEIIGWASIDDVSVTEPYESNEHDYWLGTVPAERITEVKLKAGQLAVLYPVDAHAPRRAAGASTRVRKLVIKVGVEG